MPENTKKLLHIACSPRGQASASLQLADYFITNVPSEKANWQVDDINLWDETLPSMIGDTLSAKYAKHSAQTLNDSEITAWKEIERHVHRFIDADAIIISVPLWNFSIPYVLKHYIDIITQPGLCFTWSPETGYESLLATRPAIVLGSSAADVRPGSRDEDHDFGFRYLDRWLSVYMGCKVTTIIDGPTVDNAEVVSEANTLAYEQTLQATKELINL